MSNSLDDAVALAFFVERFDDFLALEQGASVQTSRAYKLDIARFVAYASVKGAKSPIDVGARTLREYVYHLKDLGLSPASIRRNVSAVRTYFKFLLAEGHVVRDPSERLETPKKWRTLPDAAEAVMRDRVRHECGGPPVLAAPPAGARQDAASARAGLRGDGLRRERPLDGFAYCRDCHRVVGVAHLGDHEQPPRTGA